MEQQYFSIYNPNCTGFNHYSTQLPASYDIPQRFSRQIGYDGHIYDSSQTVCQNVTSVYESFSQMWNTPNFLTSVCNSDHISYSETGEAPSQESSRIAGNQTVTLSDTSLKGDAMVRTIDETKERSNAVQSCQGNTQFTSVIKSSSAKEGKIFFFIFKTINRS